MPHNFRNLIGRRFGRITVLSRAENDKHQNARWNCVCDCGNTVVATSNSLLTGQTKSCGCLKKERFHNMIEKHGQCGSRLYKIYSSMKNRCNNKHSNNYKHYGGRGIKVCDEWDNFETFYSWAMDNGYADNLTIERIDVNGDYEPDNCCWITKQAQHLNTRRSRRLTHNGITQTIKEWSADTGIAADTIRGRLDRGWTVEGALTTPVYRKSCDTRNKKVT